MRIWTAKCWSFAPRDAAEKMWCSFPPGQHLLCSCRQVLAGDPFICWHQQTPSPMCCMSGVSTTWAVAATASPGYPGLLATNRPFVPVADIFSALSWQVLLLMNLFSWPLFSAPLFWTEYFFAQLMNDRGWCFASSSGSTLSALPEVLNFPPNPFALSYEFFRSPYIYFIPDFRVYVFSLC